VGGRFVVTLPGGAGFAVCIYDPRGRLVRRLKASTATGGSVAACSWDGRTARGAIAAAGSYFYEITSPAARTVRGKISIVP
jgi:hypothetical protein